MKKLIALFMVIVMLFSLVACGSTADAESKDEATQASDNTTTVSDDAAPVSDEATQSSDDAEDQGAVQVDENLFTVEVTMAASFFTEQTEEEIKTSAKENGFISCNVNEDGSVTYTMAKAKHQEILDEYKTSMDETIDSFLNGEDKVASFLSIDYTDGFSQFDVYVDANVYSSWDCLNAFSFYLFGAYYQSFAGVPADEIDVIVNFIDNNTKEVLDAGSYKEYMSNIAETEVEG